MFLIFLERYIYQCLVSLSIICTLVYSISIFLAALSSLALHVQRSCLLHVGIHIDEFVVILYSPLIQTAPKSFSKVPYMVEVYWYTIYIYQLDTGIFVRWYLRIQVNETSRICLNQTSKQYRSAKLLLWELLIWRALSK